MLTQYYSEDISDAIMYENYMALIQLKKKAPGDDGLTDVLLKASGKLVLKVVTAIETLLQDIGIVKKGGI